MPLHCRAIDVLGIAIVTAAILVTGSGVARRLYRRFEAQEATGLEIFVAGSVIGFGVWIAASWTLALSHALTRTSVLVLAVVMVGLGTWCGAGLRPAFGRGTGGGPEARTAPTAPLLLLLPVVLWTVFVLWRATVVPVVNHDALSYHLPKAVLMMRAHGFTNFAGYDVRFASFPANYELLLAELLLGTGSDHVTEWVGAVFFVLFLAAAALLVRRWLGPGLHVAATVLAVAAAPVLLVHSGADKNDLMAQFFVLTALIFGAKWVRRGGGPSMALLVLSIGLAVGTKTNAGAIAAGLAPFLLWRLIRHRVRVVPALATIVFSVIVFVLCGGAVFIAAATSDALMGVQIGSATTVGRPLFWYRHWRHLWEIPLRMLRDGVSTGDGTKHVLFSSHFGPLFTLAALALPFTAWRYRNGSERTIAALAALLAFAIMLPANIEPEAMPRYGLFLLPVLLGMTVAPIVRELLASERYRRYGTIVLIVLAGAFAAQAVDMARHDASCPIDYVQACLRNPGRREAPSLHARASVTVDRLAAPNDTIALAADHSAWIHPLYGARLTRPVVMIGESATAADIPPSARWVVIERSWRFDSTWPAALHSELLRDGRFELVFENPTFRHSAFRRR